MEESSQGNGII